MNEKTMHAEKKRYLIFFVLGVVLFSLTYTVVLKETATGDYYAHIAAILRAREEHGMINVTCPLWHLLVYVVYRFGSHFLAGLPIDHACAIVSGAVNVFVYYFTEKVLDREQCPFPETIAFTLCFVTPIYIPWFNETLFLGQGGPVQWHNPTNLMVKPFSIVCFYLIVGLLEKMEKKERISWKEFTEFAVLVFISVFAKPSFFQGIVPALGLFIFWKLISKRFSGFIEYAVLCLCFVPACGVIAAQFIHAFFSGTGNNTGGVGFGWFEVMKHYSPDPWISLLLVLAFPLSYILCNWKTVHNNIGVQLSGIYTAVAWLEGAVLYEKGPRKYDENFEWAVMLAYAMIWITTTSLFFKDFRDMDMNNKIVRTKNSALLVVWLLHLICGFYYVYCLITVEGMWL